MIPKLGPMPPLRMPLLEGAGESQEWRKVFNTPLNETTRQGTTIQELYAELGDVENLGLEEGAGLLGGGSGGS